MEKDDIFNAVVRYAVQTYFRSYYKSNGNNGSRAISILTDSGRPLEDIVNAGLVFPSVEEPTAISNEQELFNYIESIERNGANFNSKFFYSNNQIRNVFAATGELEDLDVYTIEGKVEGKGHDTFEKRDNIILRKVTHFKNGSLLEDFSLQYHPEFGIAGVYKRYTRGEGGKLEVTREVVQSYTAYMPINQTPAILIDDDGVDHRNAGFNRLIKEQSVNPVTDYNNPNDPYIPGSQAQRFWGEELTPLRMAR